jgi:hypothetical protein
MDNSKKSQSDNKLMTININDFESVLTEIYKKELTKNINTILIDKKEKFLLKINDNVSDFIDNNYTFNYRRISLLKESFEKNQKEFLKTYTNLHDDLNDILVIFKDKQDKYLQLSEYKKHCRDSENYAIHTCKGRIIKLTDKKDNIEFLICEKCKICSLPADIHLYCNCGINYYSRILKDDEDGNVMYATWEKYHCPSLTNEKMKCIKCKDFIFFNLSENILICKSCGFKIEPTQIIWSCVFCKSAFRSKAKFHNDHELKDLKDRLCKIIEEGNLARPEGLACECNFELNKTKFFHKRECQGLLYKGDYLEKVVIVCAECKTTNYSEYYLWTCPVCFKRFKNIIKEIKEDINVPVLKSQSKSFSNDEPNNNMKKEIEIPADIRKSANSRDNSPKKSGSKIKLTSKKFIDNLNSLENIEQGKVTPFNLGDGLTSNQSSTIDLIEISRDGSRVSSVKYDNTQVRDISSVIKKSKTDILDFSTKKEIKPDSI